MVDIVLKKGTAGLLGSLNLLCDLFLWDQAFTLETVSVVDSVRCDLSSAFVDIIVDLAYGKVRNIFNYQIFFIMINLYNI